ncbi:hypothetical protein C8Q80DRAFT_1122411 [Daedaleopsis nitida]|nr:hypothetical protein C8Q80DRAFT_1122411 [Daedaleopsis nitida]
MHEAVSYWVVTTDRETAGVVHSAISAIIFSLLHPRDLLNLARTSKAFRAFLMSRHCASLWKAARQQMPSLPECPSHLSEPVYANLVFFTHCHRCLKPKVTIAIWEFSVRYCSECKEVIIPPHFNSYRLRDTSSYTDFCSQLRRESLGESSRPV